ncbi:MAG: hypothetical protein AAB414_00990 [Patescibacteria group bacterium]
MAEPQQQTYEQRVTEDAQQIQLCLEAEYRAGNRNPLSVAALSDRLHINRERVNAAVSKLVFADKTLGVVGAADSARFYPIGL